MLAFISHTDCFLHNMGKGHPERPERISAISEAVHHCDFSKQIKFYDAPIAEKKDLFRVHAKDYVESIFAISPKEGMVCLDPDTWMNSHTLKAALRAAGSAIFAVDLVLTDRWDAAFCNVRPPGHHAEHNKAMGFCFFNNLAIGVAYALTQQDIQRVAIVDFDVHHGNGTEDIFRENEKILLCSSFQHPFYPLRGFNTKSNHILNLPLPAGTDGETFREEISTHWLKAIDKFAPDMIFFSAGFDGHYLDNMANFMLNKTDYGWVTKAVREIADRHCPGRIVSLLEGGYALNALAQSVVAHLQALLHL